LGLLALCKLRVAQVLLEVYCLRREVLEQPTPPAVLAELAQLRLLLCVDLLLQTVAQGEIKVPQAQTLGAVVVAPVLIMEQVALGGLLAAAAVIVLLAEVGLVVMGEYSKLLPPAAVAAAALGWATMAEKG
jgi:hypothetical protein